jgi:hypothetical protein
MNCFRCVILLTCYVVCEGSIEAIGAFLVDRSSGKRVHLRCVNWYGAHSELYVLHGLELQSIGFLVDKLVESKANCVRIPVSSDFSNVNPIVPQHSILGLNQSECPNASRAMDVMDCVIKALIENQIMVIFNNHVSWPAWVGGPKFSHQGLWHWGPRFRNGNYTVQKWIHSMEILARRYNMTGMDLRNEIHDQDNVRITWGETNDVRSDWLAASTLATEKLHKINSELLIFVGGLCYNFDLRAMMRQVGPINAFEKRKLVYTTHVYPWSFWWNDELLKLISITSLLMSFVSILCGLTCYFDYFTYFQYTILNGSIDRFHVTKVPSIQDVLGSSMIFWVCWFILSMLFFFSSANNGCSTIASDSLWLVITSLVCMSISMAFLLCKRKINTCFWHTYWGLALVWLGMFLLSLFFVTMYLISTTSYDDFFKLWALENRPVPVWVGEFGDSVSKINRNQGWQRLWHFISYQMDLDFAYWCFNGRKWIDGKWEDESFGLLSPDYRSWRNPIFLNTIFT